MAIDTPNISLTANDKRILNALFDPETLPSSEVHSRDASTIDTSLPPHPTISASQLSLLETQQHELVRTLNSTSSLSEIEDGLRREAEIVHEWPDYPSAYLNSAMLHRMKLEASLSGSQTLFSGPEKAVAALFEYLALAIQNALPFSSSSHANAIPAALSPYQARILRTAFSHRAYLYLKAAETETAWDGKSKTDLEELASKDFAAAARYGDEVAREMSVRTNPYAKMCGAIVKNALREERAMSG
jgi:hypothetical protein